MAGRSNLPAARACTLLFGLFGLFGLTACTDSVPRATPELVARLNRSMVVIEVGDRRGVERPLGSGFIVGTNGLVATSLHVIQEARPITVHLHDGTTPAVTAIHALSRDHDLAVLQVDAADLPRLVLVTEPPAQGAPILAFGSPHGMSRSVVTGMVSAIRKIDDTPMLQVAVPIEPGNSGGPITDLRGGVLGVATMKSRLAENLGFAVRADVLKELLDAPNPIPMKAWLTIGALDPAEWETRFGASWRQRAGRIMVERPGTELGGRSLCLYQRRPEARPYSVEVSVRIEGDNGAAGLLAASDGEHRSYAFYPSRNRMRLTRFEGRDFRTWEILHDEPSEAFRPGEWNRLEMRRTERKLSCIVNGRVVFETDDDALPDGRVGLVKFRETRAEFKHFTLAGAGEPASQVSSERRAAVRTVLERSNAPATAPALLQDPEAAIAVLSEEAARHDARAEALRRTARRVHSTTVRNALVAELSQPEPQTDLLRAALMVAQLDNPDLRIEDYVTDLERMAADVAERSGEIATEHERLTALNRYLFAEAGFHGSRDEFFHPSNSYINEVIDDREGRPLTLGVLYLALGAKLGLRLQGVGPRYFLVRHHPRRGSPELIDVYRRGAVVTEAKAIAMAQHFGSKRPKLELSAPLSKRRIILQMLTDLLSLARRDGDIKAQLHYLDTMLSIDPEAAELRRMRATLRVRSGPHAGAEEDLEWLERQRSRSE